LISSTSTLRDVAFRVCTALEKAGYTAVMTGGSAATFYAPRAYVSDDIDFVLTLHSSGGDDALARLGYKRKHDFYVHPQSRFPLEFPPGPLAIGDDLVTKWKTVRRRGETLHVLTPTDSCRDRLASFLFWSDFNGLEQALAVCRAQGAKVNLRLVREWCARERQTEKFELFRSRLSGKKVARQRN
jgi:hypothetical protein